GAEEAGKGSSNTYYVVQEQDTLSKISRKFYGTPNKWNQILRANSLSSEKHIKEGMKLIIPMAPTSASEKPLLAKDEKNSGDELAKQATGSVKNNASSFREYTTQKGDTLYKIAKRIFNSGSRWQEIYEWNKTVIPDPNNLRTGIILVIK
ncbi:MAG: LysM domain-containing protein, partial [Planctomycetota bacterium]